MVVDRLIESNSVDCICVATPDEEIRVHLEKNNIDVIMTSNEHITCTDRVSEVAKKIEGFDYVLNLQGDEPIMEPENIKKFVEFSKSIQKGVTNAITKLKNDEINNPNRVKAIIDKNLVIDILRTEKSKWKQLGMYMYPIEIIKRYNKLPTKFPENLDILRFIENNIDVYPFEIETNSLSVDNLEDLIEIQKNFYNIFEK